MPDAVPHRSVSCAIMGAIMGFCACHSCSQRCQRRSRGNSRCGGWAWVSRPPLLPRRCYLLGWRTAPAPPMRLHPQCRWAAPARDLGTGIPTTCWVTAARLPGDTVSRLPSMAAG